MADHDQELSSGADATDSSRKGFKFGLPRTKGFSPAECTAITKAMLLAKNDPLNGSDQKQVQFHQHFWSRWQGMQRPDWPPRSLESLSYKYELVGRAARCRCSCCSCCCFCCCCCCCYSCCYCCYCLLLLSSLLILLAYMF